LNLCCGANVFPNWLNVDRTDVEHDYLRHLRDAPDGFVWPREQQELAAWVKAGKPLDFVRHDVRKGLPWPNESVSAIYVGQAIEHFNRRTEAPAFLRECARVLKTGGVIRLTTPSLGKLVEAYHRNQLHLFAPEQPAFFEHAPDADKLAYLLYGASGADCTSENYEGHFHCYTNHTLGLLLRECGLRPEGRITGFFDDVRDCGMSHSFAIEAVK
jgi:SAM-dependent methyltransferase